VIEDVIPLHDVRVSVRTARRPDAVRLVPEEVPVEWAWDDGYVRINVPYVNGYQMVQLAGAGL
jgi:hypothetical protein